MAEAGDDPPDPGPYRAPGDSRLGPVVARFPMMRRARYLGSARAVGRSGPRSIGSLASPPPASSPLELTRRPSGEVVELCARGLRVRARAGVLELTWDQLVAVDRLEDSGELGGLILVGVHGEEVRLDRTVRGLTELAAAIDAARARAGR